MVNQVSHLKGFTLLELILVVAMFFLVLGSGALVFGNLIGKNALRYYGHQLVQDLREVRTASISQKEDSSWGVFFDDVSPGYGYTVFKGQSYATRDASFDRNLEFPSVLRISLLNFGGAKEIHFQQSDGFPEGPGFLVLTANNEDLSISINTLGLVEYER